MKISLQKSIKNKILKHENRTALYEKFLLFLSEKKI